MHYNQISIAGMVGSVSKTLLIKGDLYYTTFTLHSHGHYLTASGEEENYYEAYEIVCVGSLEKVGRSISMGQMVEFEGELRSRIRTIDLNHRADIRISYRCWEVVATSIRPNMSYTAANQTENVTEALIALYPPEES